MSPRVLVAMSGGVDSSVAAALLHEQGYDVVWHRDAADAGRASRTHAPARHLLFLTEDFEDARRVAERMDFPFYVIDLRADFAARVIGNFVSEYLNARTPNPCVMCNREIKFDRLWSRARALETDFVATGHYARIERSADGGFHLKRAADATKDQSYFLFTLGQRELARTLFPLGSMEKSNVRERARALGLRNADKEESQEICFVPDSDYASFVERAAPSTEIRRGSIVTGDGRAIAHHNGVHNFTVGQRRGLGIAAGTPMYVREIRAASGEVVVGTRDQLNSAGLIAEQVRMVDPAWFERARIEGGEIALEVKIRYRHPALPARLRMLSTERAEVRFEHGGPAVTPGQACVFYRGDEVLGGGFIERAVEG